MKLPLKNTKKFFDIEQIQVLKEFVMFMQKQLPLEEVVEIVFTDNRPYNMTTGLRIHPHTIMVLSKGRLLVDILRTIVHEWVHEYQHQKLELGEKEKKQNIGGPDENLANILSGIMFKKFEKEYEKYRNIIYGEK